MKIALHPVGFTRPLFSGDVKDRQLSSSQEDQIRVMTCKVVSARLSAQSNGIRRDPIENVKKDTVATVFSRPRLLSGRPETSTHDQFDLGAEHQRSMGHKNNEFRLQSGQFAKYSEERAGFQATLRSSPTIHSKAKHD